MLSMHGTKTPDNAPSPSLFATSRLANELLSACNGPSRSSGCGPNAPLSLRMVSAPSISCAFLGKGGIKAVGDAFVAATAQDETLGDALDQGRERAAAEGAAQTGAVVAELRRRGDAAVEHVRAAAAMKKAKAAARKASELPAHRHVQWMTRLQEALRLQKLGVSAHQIRGGVLFASATGLRRLRDRGRSDEAVWKAVIQRCRRELKRAGRAMREAARDEDAKLYEVAKELSQSNVNALVRMQRAWRAIREDRASSALDAVWKGDKPPTGQEGDNAERIPYSDPRFLRELGAIGRAFVGKMADTPACLPLFEAWCELFLEQYETLKGSDGEDFQLAKELTWPLFLEVLHMMPKKKSVGAGGFSVELLIAAGEGAQRAFYDALQADLRGKVVPETWRTVLYALLVKPLPNNPEVVAERREIALMPQDMKLLLQMVRQVSYQRIVGRVTSAQSGWLSGYGCTDPGLVAAHIIQQRRRMGKPLYLLFIDLATFFPRVDRGACEVAELLVGLPKEVIELTALIYGAADDPEGAINCQYDSAGGLGEPF